MRAARAALPLAFAIICQATFADPPKGWNAHELSPAEEKRWIETVKTHKTRDGATVMGVLKYAEQMRPTRFKLGPIDVVYGGDDGEPDGVAIDYFIGMKRLKDDAFSIIFEIIRKGKEIEIHIPWERGYDNVTALETGRDAFLRMIDEVYGEECIDIKTNEKLC